MILSVAKDQMELDFDKEINALIRREAAGRTITISERTRLHLDADEIAAFAERAVPETTRQTFIRHFAECEQCRKILSNAIALQAGEAAETSPGIAAPVVEAAVPWYRRLFLFPNLAYVMGGLVVLFGGFIGLSVITYWSGRSEVSMMKQAENRPAVSDAQPSEAAPFSNANASVVSSGNTMSNAANSVAGVPYGSAAPASPANAASNTAMAKEVPVTVPADADKLKDLQPKATPAPPPPPAKSDNFALDGIAGRRVQEQRSAPSSDRERDKKVEQPKVVPENAPLMRNTGPMPKMKGPMRNETRERNLALENEKKRVSSNADLSAAGGTASTSRKTVGGRTFELRQGAWYDTTYSGQGTVNVRRNTEDYRKLDRGLRGIADSFLGTVVVAIWNGRAYRIQ